MFVTNCRSSLNGIKKCASDVIQVILHNGFTFNYVLGYVILLQSIILCVPKSLEEVKITSKEYYVNNALYQYYKNIIYYI